MLDRRICYTYNARYGRVINVFNRSTSNRYVCLVGGNWSETTGAGLFCRNDYGYNNGWSNSDNNVGFRSSAYLKAKHLIACLFDKDNPVRGALINAPKLQ